MQTLRAFYVLRLDFSLPWNSSVLVLNITRRFGVSAEVSGKLDSRDALNGLAVS
jgi:hypothetical protein